MKLDPIRKFALSLEAVTEEPHHHFSSFRVRGKIFVTIPPGEEFLHVFVDEQAREVALALYSEFIEKLLWGGKVVGVRVSLKAAKLGVVKSLVADAYNLRVNKDAGPTVRKIKVTKNQIAAGNPAARSS
jgi:YjbR